ncbi:unnamed protein product [Angiostrongylus costaricensis]|uniref:SCP domain-containing protein n=1 Tax=Angiostrongylus costaricensis TaxID=334426 RepID=A0A0R3PBS3_ANGCS|nr:unnamed protein product [Angiostrongylus costaricensis]
MSPAMFLLTLLLLCGTLFQPGHLSGGFEMPFGCGGMTMSDQTRQGALNLINRIRSRVALGEFQAKDYLSSANDMEAMRWHCDLETMARTAVLNCSQDPPPVKAENAMNYRL